MYAYILDILLVLISSLACIYCMLLSRRLKALQNLDIGLGASILNLTQAITDTSEAAKQARASTEESVKTLRLLITEAQDTLPLVEARIESLRASRISAKTAHTKLEQILTHDLKPEMQNAQNVSKSLLQTITEVIEFQRRFKRSFGENPKKTNTCERPSPQALSTQTIKQNSERAA